MSKGIMGGILAGGGHFLALKELVDIVTKFLDTNKDNPIIKAVIDKIARGLREEIFTKEAVKRMPHYRLKSRIEALFAFLQQNGKTGDLQAIQNVVFSYVIFENAGIPLTQSGKNATGEGDIVKKLTHKEAPLDTDDLSFALAVDFLNGLAQYIVYRGGKFDFDPALNHLKNYRLIGQMDKTFWMNVFGKSRVEIGEFFAKLKDGGPVMPRVKNFFATQFPRELPPDAITPILTELRNRLQKRR